MMHYESPALEELKLDSSGVVCQQISSIQGGGGDFPFA